MTAALYTINISNSRGVRVSFLFNAEDKCQRAYKALQAAMPGADALLADRGLDRPERPDVVFIEDDYGNTGTIHADEIRWLWMTDVKKELSGQSAMKIAQARGERDLQAEVAKDPFLNGTIANGPIMQMPPRRN